MRMLLWILVIIPAIEIWVLIQIGGEIGALPTLALLVVAFIVGVNLIRYQGVATLMNVRRQMQKGEAPGRAVADGMIRGVAGVFLIIPGFISDIIAVLLLIPPVRHLLLARWLRKFRDKRAYRGNIYEGETINAPAQPPERIGRTLDGEYRKDNE